MKINGIRIYWEYHPENNWRSVVCYIQQDGIIAGIITNATARCSHKDRFDKEKGRRISLDKALRSPRMKTFLRSDGPLNEDQQRKFRAQIWEAYRTMTKVPRWGLKQLK